MDQDFIDDGSRMGKSAIEADSNADYKQAYFLYQECLKAYIEGLRGEDQEDRIEWTHEQILIRFERLAELHAWYKRKGLLESGWLELEDLTQRLENVAPSIGSKLKELVGGAQNAQSPQPSSVNSGGTAMAPSMSSATNSTAHSITSPTDRSAQHGSISSSGQTQRPSISSAQFASSPSSTTNVSRTYLVAFINCEN